MMIRGIVVAIVTLASTSQTFAVTPAQWKYIRTLEDAHAACAYSTKPEVIHHACALKDRLIPKLKAQGFCFYGHGVVGKANRGRCYKLLQKGDGDA